MRARFRNRRRIRTVTNVEQARPGSHEWVQSWEKTGLLKSDDKNGDGILEISPKADANEITIDRDIIVLSTPEVAKLAP